MTKTCISISKVTKKKKKGKPPDARNEQSPLKPQQGMEAEGKWDMRLLDLDILSYEFLPGSRELGKKKLSLQLWGYVKL